MMRSWLDSCFSKVRFALDAWRMALWLKFWRRWSSRWLTSSSFEVLSMGSSRSDGVGEELLAVVGGGVAADGSESSSE